MNNSITYRLPSRLKITIFFVDHKKDIFQQSYVSSPTFFSIVGAITHFWNKNTFYLRTGLFARLGVTLIGLIYKIQLMLIGITSRVKEKFLLVYALLDEYAFAKAHYATNLFMDPLIQFRNHKTNTQKLYNYE